MSPMVLRVLNAELRYRPGDQERYGLDDAEVEAYQIAGRHFSNGTLTVPTDARERQILLDLLLVYVDYYSADAAHCASSGDKRLTLAAVELAEAFGMLAQVLERG
jgi:hypothetical protein